MKKILITGINGVIGQILDSALKDKYKIYGFDSRGPFTDKIKLVDIGSYQDVMTAIDSLPKIDCLIHLAAASDPKANWEIILKNNIIGVKNIFEVAKESKIKKIIFPSSTHAFGNLPGWPNIDFRQIPINTPFTPDSLYAVSKIFAEELAKHYQKTYGVAFTIVRIGSVIADESAHPEFAPIHLFHRDLIKIIEEAIEQTEPFKIIWGVSRSNSA